MSLASEKSSFNQLAVELFLRVLTSLGDFKAKVYPYNHSKVHSVWLAKTLSVSVQPSLPHLACERVKRGLGLFCWLNVAQEENE